MLQRCRSFLGPPDSFPTVPPFCRWALQLAVYTQLKWYVGQEAPGQESRMRGLSPRDLLLQLPHLQRLQRRLLDCTPHGAATHDPVVLVRVWRRRRCTPAAGLQAVDRFVKLWACCQQAGRRGATNTGTCGPRLAGCFAPNIGHPPPAPAVLAVAGGQGELQAVQGGERERHQPGRRLLRDGLPRRR